MDIGMTRGEMIRFLVRKGHDEALVKTLPTAKLKLMIMEENV